MRWSTSRATGVAPSRGYDQGRAACALLLEVRDLILLGEREADIVKPVQQAMLAMRVDVKADDAPVRPLNFLALEIDGQPRIGPAFGILEKFFKLVGRHPDRQHSVLEAVVVEDVAEGRRDHASDAEIHKAQGACSRDEPQPKLSPATKTLAWR